MNLFITEDGQYYRRWINIIPSCLIPGSGHYLSGRRKAGIIWFIADLVLMVVIVGLVLHPGTRSSLGSVDVLDILSFLVSLVMIADSCRKPIPRIGFKGWSILIGLALAMLLVPILTIRQFFVQPFKIPTRTMEPTLMGAKDSNGQPRMGDHILVNKQIYHFREPQLGDIVVFKTTGISNVVQKACYVMRVVGVPGDTIRIEPPYIIVNGQRLVDPPIFKKISESRDGYSGYVLPRVWTSGFLTTPEDSVALKSDEYLVFGDNSANSFDSRYWGPVKRKSIIGKVFYIYAPAERKGKVE